MEAPISHSVYRRSGGDHFPPRRHASPPNFCPSVAVVKSLSATIQNQVLRNGGATLHRPLKSSPHRKPSLSVRMSLREDTPSLATVGVSSTVGQESIYDRSCRAIEMLASELSDGIHITLKDNDEEMTQECCNVVDIALFSAGSSISKKFEPIVVDSELIFVDNSSAFRMDENLPLVIPEMNPKATALIKLGSGKGALISNPNYSTITCLMAATPLHRHGKVLRMFVSTYQASSGAGAAAMEELEQQIREVLKGKQPTCNIFKQQNDMNVKVTATCIRVPVMRAHAESINLKFEMPIDEDAAGDILRNALGVVVIDDRAANHFPTPLEVSNKDDVAVCRIRSDVSQDGNYGLDIFVCGDQIRKGAALNAVQIVEML